jgi:hypothetical protein
MIGGCTSGEDSIEFTCGVIMFKYLQTNLMNEFEPVSIVFGVQAGDSMDQIIASPTRAIRGTLRT